MLLGSVADWVARHAPAPTDDRARRPAAGSDDAAHAHCGCPRWLGACGIGAADRRVMLAAPWVCRSIWCAWWISTRCGPASRRERRPRRPPPGHRPKTFESRKTYLAEQVQRLRNRDLIAQSEVRTGSPASELLAAIREGDVVVLTTRERGGLARWFLGSVAEELVRHAAGPVLLVRAGSQIIPGRGSDDTVSTRPVPKKRSRVRGGSCHDRQCCPRGSPVWRAERRGPGA